MSAWRVSVVQIIQGGPVSSSQTRHGFHFYGPGGQTRMRRGAGLLAFSDRGIAHMNNFEVCCFCPEKYPFLVSDIPAPKIASLCAACES